MIKGNINEFKTTLFPVIVNNDEYLFENPMLKDIYDNFNGGLFWNGSLLIRPIVKTINSLYTVSEWNEETLWKKYYGDICKDIIFFGEDVFGCQFGVQGNNIIQFDPETANITVISDSVDGWCSEIISDPAYYTGYSILSKWENENHKLELGYKLMPKQFFIFGGEFSSENMCYKRDAESMLIRGQIWEKIKDIPDGQTIEFIGDE